MAQRLPVQCAPYAPTGFVEVNEGMEEAPFPTLHPSSSPCHRLIFSQRCAGVPNLALGERWVCQTCSPATTMSSNDAPVEREGESECRMLSLQIPRFEGDVCQVCSRGSLGLLRFRCELV